MTLRWLRGDCRETLRTLEAGSVQMCATSPPYWSLRDYGTPPLVWGGDAGHEHDWLTLVKPAANGIVNSAMQGETLNGTSGTRKPSTSGLCPCGAWLGSLGLEPDPFMYIEHIVEVFREVRRVLRDDGVIWVNMAGCYSGSGKGPSKSISATLQGGANPHSMGLNSGNVPPGFKPKDMIFMPGFIAEALRQDGWYFRAMLPWVKRNCMPSSVTDRPGTSLEYVLYMSKSRRCYWDADAVRLPQSANTHARGNGHTPKERPMGEGVKANDSFHAATNGQWLPNGRAFRDSDLFFQSWQGLLLDDDAEPIALVVNPAPLKLAHYASYPPKLVEPMVKASSRPGDWVLDPFAGSGTTLMVADRLGRNAIGCELSSEYGEMGTGRVVGDAPMFVELTSA